jgi:hypothetical protein
MKRLIEWFPILLLLSVTGHHRSAQPSSIKTLTIIFLREV